MTESPGALLYRPVLCLPKTGSTSLSLWLQSEAEPAHHEWQVEELLHLGALAHRPDFPQRRQAWLLQRARGLEGAWDVTTSLYAVLWDLSASGAPGLRIQPRWLCRSPGPWLASIVAWSLRFAADPFRRRWLGLHRGFVVRRDPALAALMPADPTSPQQLSAYWLPVWLAFQTLVQEQQQPYLLTERLPAGHHANASPPGLMRLPPWPELPPLSGCFQPDGPCLEAVRRCCLQLGRITG